MPNTLVRNPIKGGSGALARLKARWPSATRARARSFQSDHALLKGIDVPQTADWAWRPNLWALPVLDETAAIDATGARLAADATLFHDGKTVVGRVAQIPPSDSGTEGTPFALTFDVGGLDGSFLSVALEVPPNGIQGLGRRHIVGAAFNLDQCGAPQVYARFNLRHGPNTETLTRELPRTDAGHGKVTVEFDLAYVEINELRLEAAWLDVILQQPSETLTNIRDLVLYRRPRAEL